MSEYVSGKGTRRRGDLGLRGYPLTDSLTSLGLEQEVYKESPVQRRDLSLKRL